MTNSLSNLRFLQIQTEDSKIARKGRLLQLLVFLIFCMSLGRALTSIPGIISSDTSSLGAPVFIQLIASLSFLFICYFLIHTGRVIYAAHFFAIVLIIVFFVLLITDYQEETGLLYLMLVPVIAIATLDSIKASRVYTFITIVIAGIYTAVAPAFTSIDFIFYALVTVAVTITFWATANDLQISVDQAQNLADESQRKSDLLQLRTQQLENSARFGQKTGISLNLEELLADTARLINEEFNFYSVSIFLLDDTGQTLYLRHLTGVDKPELLIGEYALPNNEESIVGWAVAHRQARIANDTARDSAYFDEPLLPLTQSELALPLIVRDEVLGVLDLQSKEVNAFQDEDVAVLQIMANQLAVNIDNARLYAQTASSLYEIRTLHHFNSLLTSTIDLGEIYRRAARSITKELIAQRCLILSRQNETELKAEIGYEQGVGFGRQTGFFWETAVYPLEDYPDTENTLQTRKATVYQNSNPEKTHQILNMYEAVTCLEIPMISGKEPIGIIWIFRDETQPAFHETEVEMAQAMANQTAVVAANAQLTSDAQARVAQLSTINRMSQLLSHASSLKEIFDGARREIMALISASGMSISLVTKEGDKLNWLYGFEFGNEVDLSEIPPLPISQGLSGHVIRTREMLYVDKDDYDLRQKLQSFTVGAAQSTWLGLPMIVSGELIGVLAVENEESFSEREIQLLNTIVGPLASAIHNFVQLEEIQKALETQSKQRIQLQTAAEVAAAATQVLNLDALVQESVNLIKERFSLYYVGLFLIDDHHENAVLVSGTGKAGQVQVAAKHALSVGGQSLIGGATGDATPRIIQDVTKNEEWRPNPHLPDTKAELALPLRVGDQVIGALTAQSETPHLFTEELVQVLQTLCDQLATAVVNARLLSQSEARAQRQQTLAQISAKLHQTSDINEIINVGLYAISSHLDGANVKLHMGNTPAYQTDLDDPKAGEDEI